MGLVFYCLILLADKSAEWRSQEWDFAGIVRWTIITAFLSVIPAYVDGGQSMIRSAATCLKWTWVLLMYFLLRRWNIGTRHIMKYVIALSLVWVVIEIGQQFTYPDYWFAGRPDEGYGIAERMGLYRFYLWGVDFVMMAFAYCIGLFVSREGKASARLLLLWLTFLAGLLCYCSRKHIYVSLLTVAFAGLSAKNRYGNYIRLALALLVFLIVYNFYADFAEMNESEMDLQGRGEDFIRFIALDYFLFRYSDSPLYFWLGSGWPGGGEMLRKELYVQSLGYYRADIGIFGYYSIFGIIGTLPFLVYVWKFFRNWKYIDLWLKLFFIMKLILIVFDFWGVWLPGNMAYAIFLYMLDLNIQRNKGRRVMT